MSADQDHKIPNVLMKWSANGLEPPARELLRTRENPQPPPQARRLQRQTTPETGQEVAVGRQHAGQMVSVHLSKIPLAIDLPDGDTRVLPPTTDQPVRNVEGQRPRNMNPNGLGELSSGVLIQIRQARMELSPSASASIRPSDSAPEALLEC